MAIIFGKGRNSEIHQAIRPVLNARHQHRSTGPDLRAGRRSESIVVVPAGMFSWKEKNRIILINPYFNINHFIEIRY